MIPFANRCSVLTMVEIKKKRTMHVYNNDNNAGIDDVNNDENIAFKRCFCLVGYCEVNHGKYVSMNIHALFPGYNLS